MSADARVNAHEQRALRDADLTRETLCCTWQQYAALCYAEATRAQALGNLAHWAKWQRAGQDFSSKAQVLLLDMLLGASGTESPR